MKRVKNWKESLKTVLFIIIGVVIMVVDLVFIAKLPTLMYTIGGLKVYLLIALVLFGNYEVYACIINMEE
jgi:hypothetical protein